MSDEAPSAGSQFGARRTDFLGVHRLEEIIRSLEVHLMPGLYMNPDSGTRMCHVST